VTSPKEVDDRERAVLERGLRDLGFDPAEFTVEISELPSDDRSRSLPNGFVPRRKQVVVTHGPTGDSFRHEAYLETPWAGEVVQEVVMGRLGTRPA
jgi:hypothetical protein